MKKLIAELERFVPSYEQEIVEKEMFLYVARTIPNSLTRESMLGQFTASAWVMNEAKTHVLCAYHNIYKSWAWLGGHCDGNDNLLQVAIKEVEEETGVGDVIPYVDGIFTLEALPVLAHIKKGKHIPAHIHLNCTFVFVADEKLETRIAQDENSAVGWKEFEDFYNSSNEEHMKPIYRKIIDKIRNANE